MRYRLLVYGFFLSILIIVAASIYTLRANQQITASLEKGEEHFKAIATAATEVSSYVKRAEGHLQLYLLLRRQADKEKFPARISSLYEQIAILDRNIENPEARRILEKIKFHTDGVLAAGKALILNHDNVTDNSTKPELEPYSQDIVWLHDQFSAIRELGVQLAGFEIKLESDLKQDIRKNAARQNINMLTLIALISVFIIYLGIVLARMISNLNKEIANRMRSENLVQQEKKKLSEALTKLKVLSGLLPICVSCKKIRDDAGYWNQIENYISEHSNAEFTHGICPECSEKLYPEFQDDLD